ncbi:MAG: TetR/AcrR family transcriptional regulator [Neisseriaceae bacterium]|nr:TetR/AcrR family transcriptional regulator [Neisseriaceae bacterium]
MSTDKQVYPGRPRQFEDEDILDAAVAVFGANGYAGTSAQDLCDGTGLGRGSLYNAFGSKQALYEQALLRSHEHTMAAQLAILNQPGSARARLQALLSWGVAEALTQPDQHHAMVLFAALERGDKDAVVATLNQEYRARLTLALEAVFAEGQASGELATQASATQMARAFLAGYYGLRVLGKNTVDTVLLEDVVVGLMASL